MLHNFSSELRYCNMLFGHQLTTITDNITHGVANKHTATQGCGLCLDVSVSTRTNISSQSQRLVSIPAMYMYVRSKLVYLCVYSQTLQAYS